MKKKITIALGILFILIIIGVAVFSAYRSSESYRRKQAGQGVPVAGGADMPNSSNVIGEENTQLAEKEDIEKKEAIVNGPYGSIQLEVPDTWEFEICDVDNERLGASSYGIILKPISEAKGSVEVGYCDGFGVCGTGLESKSVILANNEAHIGYYDGSSNWSFISWAAQDCDLKNITVLCNADWGASYLDELLDILESIQFDKNNQTGGIGVYEVSSELGINDGYLNASVRNVSNTGATLVLNYSIYHENDTDEISELYFGSYLPISKKIGADWMKLEYEADGNIAFEDIAYIIKENEETTYEYNWELLYGKLEPGEYQIAIEINSEAMIYAYFILR